MSGLTMLKTMLGRYKPDVGAHYLKSWHLSKSLERPNF
jgi:hypothetical protein